jgi:hypothetical protein
MHASCSTYLIDSPWLNFDDTLRRVQSMKLLITQFSPASCHFVHLRSKYCPSTLFPGTISMR